MYKKSEREKKKEIDNVRSYIKYKYLYIFFNVFLFFVLPPPPSAACAPPNIYYVLTIVHAHTSTLIYYIASPAS